MIQKKSVAAADVQNAVAGANLGTKGGYGLCQLLERWQLVHTNPRLDHKLIIPYLLIAVSPVKKAQIPLLRQIEVVAVLAGVGAPGAPERFGTNGADDWNQRIHTDRGAPTATSNHVGT
jgi:hypothetical protein